MIVQIHLTETDVKRLQFIAGRLNLTNGRKRGAKSKLGINISGTIRESLRLTEEMLRITQDGDAMIVLDEVQNG